MSHIALGCLVAVRVGSSIMEHDVVRFEHAYAPLGWLPVPVPHGVSVGLLLLPVAGQDNDRDSKDNYPHHNGSDVDRGQVSFLVKN